MRNDLKAAGAVMIAGLVASGIVCSQPALMRSSSYELVDGVALLPRGNNYMVGNGPAERVGTINSWHLYHVILYAIVGYLAPDYWWLALIIGVLWELFEWLFWDCHDMLDVPLNMFGFAMGALVANALA